MTLSATSHQQRREYGVTFIEAGLVRRRDGLYAEWNIPPETLQAALPLLDGVAVFLDHTEPVAYPSMRNLVGVTFAPAWHNDAIVGGLRLYDTEEHAWLVQLLDQILTDQAEGREVPDVGLSLVFYGQHEQRDKLRVTTLIDHVESCDIVFGPAAEGRIKAILSKQNIKDGDVMGSVEQGKTESAAVAVKQDGLGASPLPQPEKQTLDGLLAQVQRLGQVLSDDERERQEAQVTALTAQIEQLTAVLSKREEKRAVSGMGQAPSDKVMAFLSGRDELDRMQGVVDWLFGVRGAELPDPSFRRADRIYWQLTGDYEFRGSFDRERVALASATTSTLADMAVNAMNKVINTQFASLTFWRWFEKVVDVTPNDGTLNAMNWISFGGIGNLPTVTEGGTYTELVTADVKETASFLKKGGYVGITREMIKNSDIVRIQAVPKALAIAALRTRSAAVSELFTQASGVGPTLAQDSTALFHANHGANVTTTAFTAAEWGVVSALVAIHTEVGSSKALGIFPKYGLFPAKLYQSGLAAFAYGDGYPTTYNIYAQDRGPDDPRPVPLYVPDWTDVTDWAAIVDPMIFPVIQMSYSQSPGGGTHPQPELYAVTNEAQGLMFTNDTLPIKVRDEFAVGVNGWRGIHKANVGG